MTLGGMAIAVGAVVDDAIVDVENVTRRLRENAGRPPSARRPSLEVVLDASREIRSSIVFATAIVMLVFSPLFFLSGVEGRLLQPLGFAYLISLFASLIVALTVTPALCAYLLPGVRSILEAREPALAAALKRSYERVLPHVLRHATPVILAASLLLALAVATIPFMGRAFLPAFNEGALVISAVTLPGTSLEESNVLGSAIERLLLDVPEVEATARRTGRAELDEHVQGVESAEIDVRIAPGGRPRDALLEDIRERLSLIPGTNITIGQPISHRIDHMLSGSRANVAIKVFGEDLVVLRTVGNQLVAAVQDVPGLVDLSLEPQADIPTVRVGFGRTALKRFSDSPCTAWARRGTSACTNAGGPMQAYSMDLRERALLDSDAGMKAADVAVKYRVSGSWVRLLKQRRRETGEVAPRVQRHGRRRMLEPHLHTLAALIAEQPDRTVAELKDALGTPASLATIWRAVAALDVTVKKNGPALRTRST